MVHLCQQSLTFTLYALSEYRLMFREQMRFQYSNSEGISGQLNSGPIYWHLKILSVLPGNILCHINTHKLVLKLKKSNIQTASREKCVSIG